VELTIRKEIVSGMRLRRQAAEARVEAALASLENAQRLIEQAAQALSAVNGLGAEWRRVGALHDRVRRAWYDVQGRADSLLLKDKLLLDHEPDQHEEHWRAPRRGR
jgi:hypothetical protein